MKPWQLIILIMLAVALCVVPWVRADDTTRTWFSVGDADELLITCDATDDGRIENCKAMKGVVPCLDKMEQAMRAMDQYILKPFLWTDNTTDPMLEWKPEDSSLGQYKDVYQLWTTVKQECWATRAEKD